MNVDALTIKITKTGWEKFVFVLEEVHRWIADVGAMFYFLMACLMGIFQKPYRIGEFFRHAEFIGNKSVLIVALTGTFTGMALSYQIYLGFSLVNASNLVGPTVALAISRELGPVMTGLIVAARAGGAMAAHIGTMRVSEQIDALEVMGVDPVQYLVSPRMVATLLVMPLLCAVFDFVSMAGAHFLCIKILEMDAAIFWEKIRLWIEPRHIYEGFFKSVVFGFFFATICTFSGYRTEGGARGVGNATNRGVVSSMVMTIILDYFLSHLIRFYYKIAGI
ncbi:MAG: organic solvent ABC transporter permease [Proteobacteria bacterium SG_bin7]|nr:MAG: organic solvent ABC transporter permease [Proteobacteria bacterium SG_bin7]